MAPSIMLIPISFFPAPLVCNDEPPEEVVVGPDPPVTTAGTTVTAVTVEREPLGRVVVKILVEVLLVVLLLVCSEALVELSSAEVAVDPGTLVDVGVTTMVEEDSVAGEPAEVGFKVDKTLELDAPEETLEAPDEVVTPEAVA